MLVTELFGHKHFKTAYKNLSKVVCVPLALGYSKQRSCKGHINEACLMNWDNDQGWHDVDSLLGILQKSNPVIHQNYSEENDRPQSR
jgi:hypothetical protein